VTRTVKIVAILELLAVAAFLYATRRADSLLPEHGGTGDGTAISDWNRVAGVSFYLLAFLVAVGVLVAWFQRPTNVSLVDWLMRTPIRGGPQLIVAVPIIGLALGILIISIFP